MEERTISVEDAGQLDFWAEGTASSFGYSNSEQRFYFVTPKDESSAKATIFRLDECRSFSEEAYEYEEVHIKSGRRGAYAIGEDIAAAVRKRKGRRKAAEKTGILFRFKNLELPELMISIPQRTDRIRAAEALHQIFESGTVRSGKKPSIREFAVRRNTIEKVGMGVERIGSNAATDSKPLTAAIPPKTKNFLGRFVKYTFLACVLTAFGIFAVTNYMSSDGRLISVSKAYAANRTLEGLSRSASTQNLFGVEGFASPPNFEIPAGACLMAQRRTASGQAVVAVTVTHEDLQWANVTEPQKLFRMVVAEHLFDAWVEAGAVSPNDSVESCISD